MFIHVSARSFYLSLSFTCFRSLFVSNAFDLIEINIIELNYDRTDMVNVFRCRHISDSWIWIDYEFCRLIFLFFAFDFIIIMVDCVVDCCWLVSRCCYCCCSCCCFSTFNLRARREMLFIYFVRLHSCRILATSRFSMMMTFVQRQRINNNFTSFGRVYCILCR